jgi:hypothetical protein
MHTGWTFGAARVWSALFTASRPEIHTDHADRDADSRRVRSDVAAISARFTTFDPPWPRRQIRSSRPADG